MYKDYTIPDTTFVLNFDFDIPANHEARFISAFVDSIPNIDSLFPTKRTGRPAHHPRILLKMLLFAYSRGVFSARKIVQLNEENIPMKWLTRETYVCYHSINDFRKSSQVTQLIQKAFIYFTFLLSDNDILTDNALFIDGTKIEADANKYSFTWKRAVERFETRLNDKILLTYHNLIEQNVALAIQEDELYTSDTLKQMITATTETIEELTHEIDVEPKGIKGGSAQKKKRRTLKKYLNQMVKDFLPRKEKYEYANQTFNQRNSFSKTDPDATFMCLKEDPMKNRELKPAYNLQIATNQQFVIDFALFQNPTDTKTLIPFLNQIQTLDLFHNIVADAGYGSEDNYAFISDELNKCALIPYNTYRKEKTRTFKTDPSQRKNWQYDELTDTYVDHLGVQFSFSHHSVRTSKEGTIRHYHVYKADKTQEHSQLDAFALTPSGRQRTMQVNLSWDSFKAQVRENLESESGSRLYAQRKIDVETVFGRMKRNFGVRRAHVRGQESVYNDMGLLLMTMNLTKLWGKLIVERLYIFKCLILFFFF